MSDSTNNSKSKSALPKCPTTRKGLTRWIKKELGMRIPDKKVCGSHKSPMDYLAASFLDDDGDLLVWANRGGGKTMLAAIAALLDALYKAPIDIRIIGGSFDQSDRLADYLRKFLSTDRLSDMVAGRMTRERIRLTNGADIRMLSQSQKAVRGQHAQKIRCDEVDLFDPDVWGALQFTTRSSDRARGGIEIFSTLHRPGGLMEQLVEQAQQEKNFSMFQWCLWEVIEKCRSSRKCEGCPLYDDCREKARDADGFFGIDDAIAIKARSSRSAWEAEMLCIGAKRDWLVFSEFDPTLHVGDVEYRSDWPTYRAIDFGYTSPLVCLWVQLTPAGVVHVIDEYAHTRRPIAQHAVEILRRDPGGTGFKPVLPITTYVDPAGHAKESTSGAACTELLASAGISCCWRPSTINEGLELIRAALAPASGPARLKIDRKCRGLIEAFRTYHYPLPGSTGQPDRPVKDGPDHFIDALRYFFINRMRPKIGMRRKKY